MTSLNGDMCRLARLYQKALHYQTIDPEVALIQARRAAESLSISLYNHYNINNQNNRSSCNFSFNDLIHELKNHNHLPSDIFLLLRHIQGFGNLSVHNDDTDFTEDSIHSCIHALTEVVTWGFRQLGCNPPATIDPNEHAKDRKIWIGAIDNIEHVYEESVAIVSRKIRQGEVVNINLIALDLDGRDKKITEAIDSHRLEWENVKFRALLLNPQSTLLASHCSDDALLERALQSKKHFQKYKTKNSEHLASRNIELEIRMYDKIPMFTGVSINCEYAFFSLTSMIENQLRSDNHAVYLAMTAAGDYDREDYSIAAFVSWFEFLWHKSK